MVDIERLLSYMCSGPCIAIVGAAPSTDMELKGAKSIRLGICLQD